MLIGKKPYLFALCLEGMTSDIESDLWIHRDSAALRAEPVPPTVIRCHRARIEASHFPRPLRFRFRRADRGGSQLPLAL
jgi:hypothetical protein